MALFWRSPPSFSTLSGGQEARRLETDPSSDVRSKMGLLLSRKETVSIRSRHTRARTRKTLVKGGVEEGMKWVMS